MRVRGLTHTVNLQSHLSIFGKEWTIKKPEVNLKMQEIVFQKLGKSNSFWGTCKSILLK